MPSYQYYQLSALLFWGLFIFAFGACVGSLINVIAYRLPLGIGIVTPPSRCPSCETRLTWRENIPIFGWIFLRGRCRFCKSKISPEYPIVEALVATLFLIVFATWYFLPPSAHWLGVDWGQFRPQWAIIDYQRLWPHFTWPHYTWPTLVVVYALVGSLVAMTIVDAKTFTIPLHLPWFATIVAVVVHTAHAAWADYAGIKMPVQTNGQIWFLPTPMAWAGVLGSIGGIVGLGVALVLLKLGLIRPSFADYDEWEKNAIAEWEREQAAKTPAPDGTSSNPEVGGAPGGPEMWILYPHARREMLKEAAFLAPCVLLGYLGWQLGRGISGDPALALKVLGGALTGYLVGGGVVWVVRILGSYAFGKEAMGRGDVHLMAAVGASLGWIDSILAFFGAAFVGLAWAVLNLLFSGKKSRQLPYGPFLATSTLLVLLLKPLICKLLVALGFPQC